MRQPRDQQMLKSSNLMKSVKRSGPHHLKIKLLSTHAFNYIVLRVNDGLTSFEDLTMALIMIKQHSKLLVDYWTKVLEQTIPVDVTYLDV